MNKVRILSWNVNGIRAAYKKGIVDWLTKEKPDILCVQETKAMKEQLSDDLVNVNGYNSFFSSAEKKGYSLIGSNLSGNNDYFVSNDILNEEISKLDVKTAYKESKFRESRDRNYSLSFLRGQDRLAKIKGLKVINVLTNEIENL